MERKIGEIFKFKKDWYQCVEGRCKDCHFQEKRFLCKQFITKYFCTHGIIFKKLEKVGEPYEFDGHIFQSYRTFEVPIFTLNYATVRELDNNSKISIEIKEDMEETKLNIKPFSLEAAKAGKPVCTRDGRKARIICFDRKLFFKEVSYPILALVERPDGEDDVCAYNEKGKVLIEDDAEYKDDLIMIPERKEGWVNVYKGSVCISVYPRIYKSRDEAISDNTAANRIDTVKITWEE